MEQATTSKVVSVTREANGVALIHLNRPPANSYDRGLIDELNAAIDEIRFDESIGAAVLMSDLPKFFSAGADINMFRTVSSKARAMTILHMHEVLLKMEHTPKVFIAAIGGHCLGGGLEIALATDFRFAAEGEYRLGVPEVTLGLLPGNGGTQRLPRLIGRQKAMELLVTGKPLDPTTAAAVGVVDRLVPPDARHLNDDRASRLDREAHHVRPDTRDLRTAGGLDSGWICVDELTRRSGFVLWR